MSQTLLDLASSIAGCFISPVTCVQVLGGGNINDSFLVRSSSGADDASGSDAFVLQRINSTVFPNPRAVCDNVAAICSHLQRHQQQHASSSPITLQVISPLPCPSSCASVGPHFVVDHAGGYWRCTRFVDASVSLEVMSSAALATSVAAAFGHFSSCMRSFTGILVDTIPGFHDTPRRLAAWQHAVDSCALPDRLLAAQHYVAFVHERTARAGVLVSAMRSGAIPTSVSHNDAKIGNVLLKQSDHSFMCIIDLDTTMQGTPLYDFGDLCRTAVPGCEEDERELANIQLRMAMFRALTRGFIQGCGGRLTQAEAELLCTAVWVITFEQGVRFFTDYLNGDVYYTQRRPNHNWDRLRAQFRIVELLEQQQHAMEQMVAEEWVACGGAASSSSLSFAAQAPDHLFCEKAPEAKMLSASSGRLSQAKKMMHFTSGR